MLAMVDDMDGSTVMDPSTVSGFVDDAITVAGDGSIGGWSMVTVGLVLDATAVLSTGSYVIVP